MHVRVVAPLKQRGAPCVALRVSFTEETEVLSFKRPYRFFFFELLLLLYYANVRDILSEGTKACIL